MMPNKEELSENLAVDIIQLVKWLSQHMNERIISHQIGKSGTSIGANIAEARYAESDVDMIHKLAIAQKECGETIYWLKVLKRTDYIDESKFKNLHGQCMAILRVLSSIIVKLKKS